MPVCETKIKRQNRQILYSQVTHSTTVDTTKLHEVSKQATQQVCYSLFNFEQSGWAAHCGNEILTLSTNVAMPYFMIKITKLLKL